MRAKKDVTELMNEFVNLETDAQRETFRLKMRGTLSGKSKEELEEFGLCIEAGARETINQSEKLIQEHNFKETLMDIMPAVTWSYIAEQYFGKSRSWFSQRMNGYHVNNKEATFTTEEIQILKNALLDLSNRLNNSAHRLGHCL